MIKICSVVVPFPEVDSDYVVEKNYSIQILSFLINFFRKIFFQLRFHHLCLFLSLISFLLCIISAISFAFYFATSSKVNAIVAQIFACVSDLLSFLPTSNCWVHISFENSPPINTVLRLYLLTKPLMILLRQLLELQSSFSYSPFVKIKD